MANVIANTSSRELPSIYLQVYLEYHSQLLGASHFGWLVPHFPHHERG